MPLGFIPPIVAAVLLIVGVLGVVFRSPIATAIAKINPLFPAKITLMILLIVGIVAGGIGGLALMWAGVSAQIAGIGIPLEPEVVPAVGEINVLLSGGLANATTTEDYYNDEKDFLTFYSADASIAADEDYSFNATIERSAIAEDANIKVTCSAPDKELSGVTDDNLIDKDAGQIDLVFGGDATSTGTYTDDNTVWTYVAFAEGTGSKVVSVTFEHVEEYHDGMADLDDYFDVSCKADGVPFTARVYANS